MSLYGESGPPNGYSAPRYESKDAKRRCQKCGSTEHWTFECKAKSEKDTKKSHAGKLSRTQMLKYGVKRERVEFVPELTEREQADADFKEIEKTLVAEVKHSNDTTKKTKSDGVEDLKEEKEKPCTKHEEEGEEPYDITVKEETGDED